MTQEEAIQELYKEWVKNQNESYPNGKNMNNYFNEYQKKCMFLSDAIIGITTYSDSLSAEFGDMILNTLIQINNKTTFEYIENKDNHRNFILSCNFIIGWIDWGTSIRGAWFNTSDGKIETEEALGNVSYHKDYLEITEDFMNWFIGFLSCK
jgi:hypothetical protein